MNRLILIGNGFDIAHKIKTSYKDFILDYLKKSFSLARDYGKYEDEFLTVIKNNRFDKQLNSNPYINTWELNNFYGYIQSDNSLGITVTGRPIYKETLEYSLKLKNNLISILLSSCRESNWVDIENEYYKILCELSSKNKIQEIIELNKGFELLQNLLYNYLTRIEEQHSSHEYDVSKSYLVSQLTEPIKHNLAPQSKKTVRGISINTNDAPTPSNILFLNFNYTSTIETYVKEIRKTIPNTNVIYIHGKLNDINNPMIFGYGDEEETNFEVLEKYDECLKYVKTYWYLRTNNYENFLKFIDSDEFEVYVMGHSCGMSDKTMLSSIFNNSNCKKIKILTYDM
ncbi:hypothetical protein BA768_19400 [Chryseobacterium sp. CBo1]|uniref:AbiH family protein n=1 Tax=Chryseobacterium sp. CBo1 TaxID=1869230 RepID=UPI000810B060|nr:AbiH family protein [Chryseobacterium sp. CBo1]OCK50683.1 hypothetical protein BA768_19400 [Chryseobacterium sp. CBo1]